MLTALGNRFSFKRYRSNQTIQPVLAGVFSATSSLAIARWQGSLSQRTAGLLWLCAAAWEKQPYQATYSDPVLATRFNRGNVFQMNWKIVWIVGWKSHFQKRYKRVVKFGFALTAID